MYGFKFLVYIGVVLVLLSATDNKVTAAPAPDPCLWMLDHGHGHGHPDPHPTTTTTTTTTAKPDLVEVFGKLKNKKTNQLEKLVTDWIMWGPASENQKSRSRIALERMISSYMKFLTNIFNNMF
ncbi:hypothetical protein PYW07_015591 [Mythimna separata]|uniref:Uncharacterized protein n=1 Tax=Mythimna separata TaxID=271217 RepID=A0AAD8DZZ9_MYTSE|nr:hypothetical protein PYW07_015591 [Mythimna separata]